MSTDTFKYVADAGDGEFSASARLQGHTLFAAPGYGYEANATGVWFLAATEASVFFDPGSGFNGVLLEGGGTVGLNGLYNYVTGRGAITAQENAPDDTANTFDIARAVTHFEGLGIAPGDTFRMHGFTQANIANAFANVDRAGRTSETLTFSHPGGRSVSFGSEYGQMPTMAQFHPA